MRRLIVGILVLSACGVIEAIIDTQPQPAAAPPRSAYLDDFDAAWTFVRDRYAYFDRKHTDWERVRGHFRPRAAAVRSRGEFVALLEDVVEELYDHHAHLGINTPSSPRLVPSGTDVWAEYRGGRPVITDVRAGSDAERAGVRPGMEVLSIARQPVADVVRERMPIGLRDSDPAAHDWALRAALAGRHDAPVDIAVRGDGGIERFAFRPGRADRAATPLAFRVLDDDNVGYLRLHDSLGDHALIAAFDAALESLRYTRGMILDLRDTPGGGNTTVARGLLGRLVSDVRPYQRHDLPAEERQFGVRRIWVEYVAPRGPFTYEMPMVVLVGRWTGSMGEGTAIALDGLRRATVVGTPMAGLLGATDSTTLRHTGISVRVPVERLFHIDGTPREAFLPSVRVDAASGGGKDPLDVARELLRKQIAGR